MAVARLCLLLHQTPEAVRKMTTEEIDAISYLLHCEQHKREEETKIAAEKAGFNP